MFASKDTLLTRPSGYNIARSVRIRSSASAYFNRTPASAGNRQKWTWSGWVKRGTLGTVQIFTSCYSAATDASNMDIGFYADDTLRVVAWTTTYRTTTQVFRDPSSWYHLIIVIDTTQATANDRVKLYVNGTQVTAFTTTNNPTQNSDIGYNQAATTRIGSSSNAVANLFDGYLTEINFIDGQALTPSSFGETDSITGVWKPKAYSGTYGTNGFELNFSDNSNNTATTIGKDYSGNGNNWTPNNISVTTGATYDSMVDSPTVGATSSNYAVLNPLVQRWSVPNATFSNGNLSITTTSASHSFGFGTISNSSGKWYYEATVVAIGTNTPAIGVGGENLQNSVFTTEVLYLANGNKEVANVTTSYGASYTTNDVIGVAYDLDGGTITFYKNNTSQGSISLPVTTNILPYFDVILNANFAINFGQRPFSYTPPTGFVALNTYNLVDSTIKNGAAYMAATTFTSVSGSNAVVNTVNGVGFQPDLVWIKARSNAQDHYAIDSVRSGNSLLRPNQTNAESIISYWIDSFNSNGFTTNTTNLLSVGYTYVAWQWKKGASSGFDVVSQTLATTGINTITHSLNAVPTMVLAKKTSAGAEQWLVYHASGTTQSQYLGLNTTAAVATSGNLWGSSAFTSSQIYFNGTSGNTYVFYIFAPVAGYSAFGSYDGNNVADGSFVYLGFRPRFIMIKSTSASTEWVMIDTTRSSYNLSDTSLYANRNYSESTIGTVDDIDILSNGFKLRNNTGFVNSSQTYIYAAFAENPMKYALAR